MAESVHLVMFVQNVEYVCRKIVGVFVRYIANDYNLGALLRESNYKVRPLLSLNVAEMPFRRTVDSCLIVVSAVLQNTTWALDDGATDSTIAVSVLLDFDGRRLRCCIRSLHHSD